MSAEGLCDSIKERKYEYSIEETKIMDFGEVEQAILADIAKKVIEVMPEEKKREILEASLSQCLKEIMKPWHVKGAIEKDVNTYMAEYIKQPEVQERVKVAVHNAIDELLDGVVRSIVIASQDVIKSNYRKFVEKEDK